MRPSSRFVVLTGYYHYCNFGDDLMCAIFGEALRKRGIPFRVLNIHEDLQKELGFNAVNSVEDVVGADAVVYGGGGAFLTNSPDRKYSRFLSELCDALRSHHTALYLISVGGDGQSVGRLDLGRRALLECSTYITLRNTEDVVLLQQTGKEGEIHPDVVWGTSRWFRLERKPNSIFTVGIDGALARSKSGRVIVWFLRAYCWLMRKPCRFLMIYQNKDERRRGVEGAISYREIHQFISEVVDVDLVLTHRLHLGMVAMSYNCPALLIFPQPKAELVFRRLQLDSLIFRGWGATKRLLKLFSNISNLRSLPKPYENARILDAIENSEKHLEKLFSLLGFDNTDR